VSVKWGVRESRSVGDFAWTRNVHPLFRTKSAILQTVVIAENGKELWVSGFHEEWKSSKSTREPGPGCGKKTSAVTAVRVDGNPDLCTPKRANLNVSADPISVTWHEFCPHMGLGILGSPCALRPLPL
jgi:hypothetical protein